LDNNGCERFGYTSVGTDGVGRLCLNALRRILEAPRLELADDRRWRAAALIQREIPALVRYSMLGRMNSVKADEFRKLVEALKKYDELARSVHFSAYYPPPVPDQTFMRQVCDWMSEIDDFQSRGRRPIFWKQFFLPFAVGLYAAIYELDPTATAGTRRSANGEVATGYAALFVECLRSEVRQMIVRQNIGQNSEGKDLAAECWPERAQENLERSIAACLKAQDSTRRYRDYRNRFRDELDGEGIEPLRLEDADGNLVDDFN
jgi:hypothetical protein